MEVTPNALRRDTVQLIHQINTQIRVVEQNAMDQGISAQYLRDSTGNWPLATLLLAKAQAYSTLVQLQTPR